MRTKRKITDMMESLLYELLSHDLYPYHDKLVKEEDNDLAEIKSIRTELEKALTAEQLKLADKYRYLCVTRDEYIEFQMKIKFLNYGVKIGMQLQKAFDEEDE